MFSKHCVMQKKIIANHQCESPALPVNFLIFLLSECFEAWCNAEQSDL